MKRMRTYFLLAVCIAGCGGAMQAAVPQKDTAYVEDYKNLQVWSLNRLTVDTQKKAIQKYIKQNAKVIAFNVDPNFNDAIDGLMYIRISDLPESTIKPVLEELSEQLKDNIN